MKHLQYHLNKIFFALILLIIFIIPLKIKASYTATSDFYVNDYANVLNDETKKHIMDNSIALYNADKTQIVVTTVESLDGNSIEDYALNMFRNFGIGDKSKNNGILILLSISDRKVRIEVGYGLEGIINDGKAGRIIDNYMIPDLKNNDWNNGIKKGYDAVFAEIVHQNNLKLNYDKSYVEEESDGILSLILLIILTPFNIILGYKLRKKNNIKTKKFASRYILILFLLMFISYMIPILDIIGFILFFQLFVFLISYSGLKGIKIYPGSSSSFRGGSSSGGSSFSGGGGSSGGGGASRGF